MFKKENKAGLYLTVAFHLLLLIILLASKIHYLLSEESSFILDFTKEELIREIEKREQLKEEISKELDAILSGANNVRNVIVDQSSRKEGQLKDDRFRDPSQVYNEAKELQRRLDAARREAEAYRGADNAANPEKKEEITKESYKGPSVLSYFLENRKAISLPIPVYKCVAGGEVVVSIVVNRKGYVVSATIVTEKSSNDKCISDYAIRAAKSSRFTASATAPERQTGEIIYLFIAQ